MGVGGEVFVPPPPLFCSGSELGKLAKRERKREREKERESVCVYVTPNHFRNLKAFAIIHHLSTAMSALQQCLVVRLPRPSLPLGATRRLCVCVCVFRSIGRALEGTFSHLCFPGVSHGKGAFCTDTARGSTAACHHIGKLVKPSYQTILKKILSIRNQSSPVL